MGDNGADDRAAKRARVDDDPLDVTVATRDQLSRTTDPHLQAKLLLEYSAQAVAPTAATEAAIDFLFAFLQQSQSAANGDQTRNPPGNDSISTSSANSGSNNAVVVAAIVRGLRGLLAVKPHLVEPMIQLDAMEEQLAQCISVPEDFKLRRDMLHIVLDCLVTARKFRETEDLLQTCVADHDEGLRVVCLAGYERILSAGHRLQDALAQELVDRLREMLFQNNNEITRATAAKLLGVVAETSFESPSAAAPLLQESILNTLAAAVRDPAPRVRLQVATAFRGFKAATSPMALYGHLLNKKQVNEELAEIETQSIAMLTSGALLTLLEDDKTDVAVVTSSSMRILCEAGHWSTDLMNRAVSNHIELAARIGHHPKPVMDVLHNLKILLQLWSAKESSCYPISCEELCYLLGSVVTASFSAICETFAVLRLLSIDTPKKATRVIQYFVQCSQMKADDMVDATLVKSLQTSVERLVGKWVEDNLVLPASTTTALRDMATGSSVKAIAESCQLLHDALCRPSDRLADRATHIVPSVSVPSFLG